MSLPQLSYLKGYPCVGLSPKQPFSVVTIQLHLEIEVLVTFKVQSARPQTRRILMISTCFCTDLRFDSLRFLTTPRSRAGKSAHWQLEGLG